MDRQLFEPKAAGSFTTTIAQTPIKPDKLSGTWTHGSNCSNSVVPAGFTTTVQMLCFTERIVVPGRDGGWTWGASGAFAGNGP